MSTELTFKNTSGSSIELTEIKTTPLFDPGMYNVNILNLHESEYEAYIRYYSGLDAYFPVGTDDITQKGKDHWEGFGRSEGRKIPVAGEYDISSYIPGGMDVVSTDSYFDVYLYTNTWDPCWIPIKEPASGDTRRLYHVGEKHNAIWSSSWFEFIGPNGNSSSKSEGYTDGHDFPGNPGESTDILSEYEEFEGDPTWANTPSSRYWLEHAVWFASRGRDTGLKIMIWDHPDAIYHYRSGYEKHIGSIKQILTDAGHTCTFNNINITNPLLESGSRNFLEAPDVNQSYTRDYFSGFDVMIFLGNNEYDTNLNSDTLNAIEGWCNDGERGFIFLGDHSRYNLFPNNISTELNNRGILSANVQMDGSTTSWEIPTNEPQLVDVFGDVFNGETGGSADTFLSVPIQTTAKQITGWETAAQANESFLDLPAGFNVWDGTGVPRNGDVIGVEVSYVREHDEHGVYTKRYRYLNSNISAWDNQYNSAAGLNNTMKSRWTEGSNGLSDVQSSSFATWIQGPVVDGYNIPVYRGDDNAETLMSDGLTYGEFDSILNTIQKLNTTGARWVGTVEGSMQWEDSITIGDRELTIVPHHLAPVRRSSYNDTSISRSYGPQPTTMLIRLVRIQSGGLTSEPVSDAPEIPKPFEINDFPKNSKIRVNIPPDYAAFSLHDRALIKCDQPITFNNAGSILMKNSSAIIDTQHDVYVENTGNIVGNMPYSCAVASRLREYNYYIDSQLDISLHSAGQAVVTPTTLPPGGKIDITLGVSDYQVNIPSTIGGIEATYRCPAGSDNFVTHTQKITLTHYPHFEAPVEKVFLCWVNSTPVELTRKEKISQGLQVCWYEGPGSLDGTPGRWWLEAYKYNNEWTWGIKFNAPGEVKDTLYVYTPENNEYKKLSRSSFPPNFSYSVSSQNTNKIWKPLTGDAPERMILSYNSPPVPNGANDAQTNLISNLEALHRTDINSKGNVLQLEWTNTSDEAGNVYVVEYFPYSNTSQEALSHAVNPITYIVPGSNWDGTDRDHTIQITTPEDYASQTGGNATISNDIQKGPGTYYGSVRVTPVDLYSGSLMRFKREDVKDTFPTIKYIFDQTAGNGILTLSMPGTWWSTGSQAGVSESTWINKYNLIEPVGIAVTLSANKEDIIFGADTSTDWSRGVVIPTTSAAYETVEFKGLPMLDADKSFLLSWTFGDVVREQYIVSKGGIAPVPFEQYFANWKTGLPTSCREKSKMFTDRSLLWNVDDDMPSNPGSGYWLQKGGDDSLDITYISGDLSWEQARLDSIDRGGQLAVIKWSAQHDVLKTYSDVNGNTDWLGGIRVQSAAAEGKTGGWDLDTSCRGGREYFYWSGSRTKESDIDTSRAFRKGLARIPSGYGSGTTQPSIPSDSSLLPPV